MKKIFLIIVAILCNIVMAFAEPVTEKDAREKAAQFILSMKGNTSSARSAQRSEGAKLTAVEAQKEVYVFNINSDDGFVIMSGDDCVGDNLVLGYTNNGSFSADNIPSNLQWWLNTTAEGIARLKNLGVKATSVPTHNDIAPMITTKWGQGSNIYNPKNPYNAYCPVTTDGKLCVTGCMATALSQVMYYYRWPQGPIACELPAYTMKDGSVIDGLPVTTFDWNNMVDDYTVTTTEEQQSAVAVLMRYCGQSVQMLYSPDISYGIIYDIDLLVNSFGYDPDVYRAVPTDYSLSEWDNLIYNELREGRPVVYGGSGNAGGHAFVLDGYEVQKGEGYFSVNWGWRGVDNGFYKINLLNPPTGGAGVTNIADGFNNQQNALIGLQPLRNPSVKFHRYLNSLTWDFSKDNIEHWFAMINSSYRHGVFTIGLAERNDDGTPDLSNICYTKDFEATGYDYGKYASEEMGIVYVPYTEDFFSNLSAGNHKLVFVNRESDTNAPWKPVYGPSSYIEVNIGDGGEINNLIFHPQPQLTASSEDIEIVGLKQRDLLQTIKATISNSAAANDFIGNLLCTAFYMKDGKLIDIGSSVMSNTVVEAGGKGDIYFDISVPWYGDYVFLIANDDDTKSLIGTDIADIQQAPGYVGHQTATFEQLNFGCLDMGYSERPDENEKLTYNIDFIIANGTPIRYNAMLYIKLFKSNTQGIFEPVVFPGVKDLSAICVVESETWRLVSVPLPEALEPGEYGVDMYIARDFYTYDTSKYFFLDSYDFEVEAPTDIKEIDNEQLTDDNKGWHDLNGRLLPGKPTKKGIYIHKGRKVSITNNR